MTRPSNSALVGPAFFCIVVVLCFILPCLVRICRAGTAAHKRRTGGQTKASRGTGIDKRFRGNSGRHTGDQHASTRGMDDGDEDKDSVDCDDEQCSNQHMAMDVEANKCNEQSFWSAFVQEFVGGGSGSGSSSGCTGGTSFGMSSGGGGGGRGWGDSGGGGGGGNIGDSSFGGGGICDDV